MEIRPHREVSDRKIPGRNCLHPEVKDMKGRHLIEIDVPEYARKAEKVLVLKPAAARPFVDLDRKPVPALLHVGREFKFGRREGILAVAHELPVQPEGEAALHTAEGNENPVSVPPLRYADIPHIASDRIRSHGRLPAGHILVAVPGVLNIHILGLSEALHLDMGGHIDVIPARDIKIFSKKAGNDSIPVFCIMEFIKAVKTKPHRGKEGLVNRSLHIFPGSGSLKAVFQHHTGAKHLVHIGVDDMVGMSRKCIDFVYMRVRKHPVIKVHHTVLRISSA